MKKISFSMLMVIMTAPLFAGTVISVSGKVDVMSGGKWQSAKTGMKISDGTKIMTGVKGFMKVESDHGTFSVKELSMVTYNEKTSGKTVDQSLDMEMGKVQVKFKKIKGIDANFKVKTPKGTASVRGTEKIVTYYPASGMDVTVLEGVVDVLNNFGTVVPTREGQGIQITFDSDFKDKIDEMRERFELNQDNWSENDKLQWRIINDILDDVFKFDDIPGLSNEPERL